MSRARRQRFATWVLTRCASDYRRDSFIGDLVEQREERGDWWYWRQALGAIRARAVSVLLTATDTNVPVAEFIGDLILSIALGLFGFMQILMYAGLFISWMPMSRSECRLNVISALIAAALMGVAITIHEVRARTFRVS